MWKNTFSFEGRIRRTEYGLTFLIVVFGRTILIMLLAGIMVGSGSRNMEGYTVLSYFLSIPFLWFFWAQGAKRCHDMGKSGWWQLIPFFPLVMIFKEGDSHTNEYGDNPKGNGFNNVSGPINAPTIPGNTIRTGSYNGGHNAGSGVNTSQTSNFNTAQGNGTPRPSQPNSSQSGSYKSGDLYK
jgi:uncharacterized membrane protein YhaH (DUF805 family)